jgi:hypothetical protein
MPKLELRVEEVKVSLRMSLERNPTFPNLSYLIMSAKHPAKKGWFRFVHGFGLSVKAMDKTGPDG